MNEILYLMVDDQLCMWKPLVVIDLNLTLFLLLITRSSTRVAWFSVDETMFSNHSAYWSIAIFDGEWFNRIMLGTAKCKLIRTGPLVRWYRQYQHSDMDLRIFITRFDETTDQTVLVIAYAYAY